MFFENQPLQRNWTYHWIQCFERTSEINVLFEVPLSCGLAVIINDCGYDAAQVLVRGSWDKLPLHQLVKNLLSEDGVITRVLKRFTIESPTRF